MTPPDTAQKDPASNAWVCGRGTFVASNENWPPTAIPEQIIYRNRKTFNPFLRGMLYGFPISALLWFIIIEIWRHF